MFLRCIAANFEQPNITLPPPIDPFQGPPPNQPPLHLFCPPPSATNVSVPPPATFPDISLPPPNTTFPPPLGSQPPTGAPPQGSGPSWWKDALAKAKDIASVIGKPPPSMDAAPPSVPPPGYQTENRAEKVGGHHGKDFILTIFRKQIYKLNDNTVLFATIKSY